MSLALDTSNFYKFIATLSLGAMIYFFSFDIYVLEPHNKRMSEANLEIAKSAAETGYLQGISFDLESTIPDSIKEHKLQYFYHQKRDTAAIFFYYETDKLKGNVKTIVDSLNDINKRLAEVTFRNYALHETIAVLENNFKIRQVSDYVLGTVFLFLFIWALVKWYKNKNTIDR